MVRTLYGNNGYIYSRVEPQQTRRIAKDGTPMIDLRWTIVEGPPATINKIEIVGNDVTHERVIREAIVMVPGQLFNRDLLLRSYQNISNIGFFQQPMAPPDVQPTANGVDVNIIFRVQEKRTGNINFGASVGQGTGIGGFLGLQEPNLFGQGKRGSLQWQFGRNINNFTLSYTDPAFRQSRISATISLYNSRLRYTIGDLGNRQLLGGSLQLGFPLLGARYTKLFASVQPAADQLHQRVPRTAAPVPVHRLHPVHHRPQRGPGHPDRHALRHRGDADQRREPSSTAGRWAAPATTGSSTSRDAGTPRWAPSAAMVSSAPASGSCSA